MAENVPMTIEALSAIAVFANRLEMSFVTSAGIHYITPICQCNCQAKMAAFKTISKTVSAIRICEARPQRSTPSTLNLNSTLPPKKDFSGMATKSILSPALSVFAQSLEAPKKEIALISRPLVREKVRLT